MPALTSRTSARACSLVLASLSLLACGTQRQVDGGESQQATDTDADTDTAPDESSESGSSSTETGDTDDTTPTGPTDTDFVPDTPVAPESCDPWMQDCVEGEKCVPYVSGLGQSYDAHRCVPITGDQAPGEPCISTGPNDAVDDCDASSICFNLVENDNAEEFTGTCVAQCTGTPDMPTCDEQFFCSISGDSSLSLCLPLCDPLGQTGCSEGQGCFWSGQAFTCIPTTQDIPLGQTCGFINDCEAGLICVTAEVVPGCEGPSCCAAFCDLEQGDPPCADALPGTSCVSFCEPGMEEPGYENVGVCIAP